MKLISATLESELFTDIVVKCTETEVFIRQKDGEHVIVIDVKDLGLLIDTLITFQGH